MSLFSSSQQFYGYAHTWGKLSLFSSEIGDSLNQSRFYLQQCAFLLVKSMDLTECSLVLKLISIDELEMI